VVIISIDGLRPDRLLLADTPVLHGMVKEGAYTFWAKTTAVSITLPSHVSMLTGMAPNKHGIEWNDDLPLSVPVYPHYPTIFETARLGGYTTAMVCGKSKFGPLTKPGTLDYVFLPEKNLEADEPVADEAVKVIRQLKPDLLFVHLPTVDRMGHQFGWGSPEQLAAIGLADQAVGRVVTALEETGLRKSTFILVTSDHGGQGKVHGPDDARSRHIPWIATGPGVRRGFDLTQIAELEIRTEDTAATALYLLGAPMPLYLQGKPVLSAFDNVTK
jgi:arylsulfatase A-like enzyme